MRLSRPTGLPSCPAIRNRSQGSGRPHEIYRCHSCSVAVWSVYGARHKLLFVRVGTLDDPAALMPDVHRVTLPEGVPCFDAYYDALKLWPPASLERRHAIFG
jgi:hypothetical protein